MTISALTATDFAPKPFEEAQRHFAKKAALTDAAFESLSKANRQRAFRIAGVHKAKLIQRARDIVDQAVRDGTGFREVRLQLLELFKSEQLPAPALHRLQTLYRQNVFGAYSAARTEVLREPEIIEAFPYWQYLTVGNGRAGGNRVRATHAALHGLVFRADDPFWDRHDPPWEYGCRCFKRALTAQQVKRMRVKVRDVHYVRTKLIVPGQRRRGLSPNPDFGFDAAQFDVSRLDEELRKVVEEMLE